MAALTEPTAVESHSVEFNHKEAFSDSQHNGQAISTKNPDTNVVNTGSTVKCAEDAHIEESENKKFIEAPIPKVNPWTVNRNGQLKPARHHFLGE